MDAWSTVPCSALEFSNATERVLHDFEDIVQYRGTAPHDSLSACAQFAGVTAN